MKTHMRTLVRGTLKIFQYGLLCALIVLSWNPAPASDVGTGSLLNSIVKMKKMPSCAPVKVQLGVASWYGPGFHGRKTSSGERYDMNQFTAAHRTLPLNTQVLVTNRLNGESVILRINDRGPYVHGRMIDLSLAAAKAIDMRDRGISPVEIRVLCQPAEAILVLPPRKPTSI